MLPSIIGSVSDPLAKNSNLTWMKRCVPQNELYVHGNSPLELMIEMCATHQSKEEKR